FIPPRVFRDYAGINENDSIIFTNFRSDRIIQIAKKILKFKPKLAFKIGMTGYSEELNEELICLFPKQTIQNSLGEILSNNNKTQLRIAETEKYAHVTFFFNGGAEDLYLGEERVLIPSPDVDTYDLKPEMSTNEVTDRLIDAIKSKKYDFIVVNYANGDMVGHSGNMKAAIEAVKTLDIAIERISKAVNDENGFLIITADHGNVEYMFDEANNTPHTSHTLNPVPLVLVANDLYKSKIKLDKGTLSDIAPLVLKLMNIDKPKEMTGNALIKDKL
ncbi:MAG: 2,3-bisphosphoglycerate-independent phosphoglycerate mutase, partial [Pseudomonadota bacterium]